MSESDIRVLVATSTPVPSQGGYLEAGRVKQGVAAIGTNVSEQLVSAVSHLAREMARADLPAGVSAVKIRVGLVLSAEFGVSIAGLGVEGDVDVEISWKP